MQNIIQTRLAAAGRGSRATISLLVALAASALLLAFTPEAWAETGTQRFHITYSGPFDPADLPESRVTAAGPIKGKGYENVIGVQFGPAPGTGVLTTEFVFPEGSVFLTSPFTVESRFNEHSCKAFQRFSGDWVITGGTGAYAGATGEGTVQGHNIVSGEKTDEGCAQQPDTIVRNFRLVGVSTVPDDQAA